MERIIFVVVVLIVVVSDVGPLTFVRHGTHVVRGNVGHPSYHHLDLQLLIVVIVYLS